MPRRGAADLPPSRRMEGRGGVRARDVDSLCDSRRRPPSSLSLGLGRSRCLRACGWDSTRLSVAPVAATVRACLCGIPPPPPTPLPQAPRPPTPCPWTEPSAPPPRAARGTRARAEKRHGPETPCASPCARSRRSGSRVRFRVRGHGGSGAAGRCWPPKATRKAAKPLTPSPHPPITGGTGTDRQR